MKKSIKSLSLSLFILLIAQIGFSAEAVSLEGKVKEHVLDNGLRIVVVERHFAPVFFALTSFRVGSSQEQPDRSGLSHYLEHMLFKGTKSIGTTNFEAEVPIMNELEVAADDLKNMQMRIGQWRLDYFEEYARRIKAEFTPEIRQEIGADEAAAWRKTLELAPVNSAELPDSMKNMIGLTSEMGTDYWEMYRTILEDRARLIDLTNVQREYIIPAHLDGIYDQNGAKMVNAFTSYDQTTYMVSLPSNCLELFMYLESDRYVDPIFREFYSEKEVILEEKRQRGANPGAKLYEAFLGTAFTAHPYGRPIIGWMSDIQLTNRTDMEEHFKRYYAPNNCQITMVGAVDAEEVFKLADEYFKDWKASEIAHEVTTIEPEQKGERRVTVEHDAEPQLIIGYHIPVAPHPDSYALTIIQDILATGKTSRFYKSIYLEKGLTHSPPDADTSPADRYPNMLTISAAPKAPHTNEEVEEAILAELERLKNEPVSDRELERIHNRQKMNQVSRLSSNGWLAHSLSGYFVNRGDWRFINEDFERMMEVTPADIQRVAEKYLTAQNRTVAVLVKPEVKITADDNEMGDQQ